MSIAERGLSLLDLVVVLALVAVLIYLVGLDRRAAPQSAEPVPVAAHVPS